MDSDAGNVAFGGIVGLDTVSLYAEIGGVLMWISDVPSGQVAYASISGDQLAWYSGAWCEPRPIYETCAGGVHAYLGGQRGRNR